MNLLHTRNRDCDNRNQLNALVDVINLSDEEDQPGYRTQPGYRMKMELLEELSDIENNDHDIPGLSDGSDDDNNTENGSIIAGNEDIPPAVTDMIATKKGTSIAVNNEFNHDNGMRIHPGEMPYRKAVGEKPFRCDICDRSFTKKYHVKRHKVSHIPYHCRGCLIGFTQKIEKDAHEKVCKKRRYECHICKKFVTLYKYNLTIHMRRHSGVKPFRCEICMQRFTKKENLKKHLQNIHTRKNP